MDAVQASQFGERLRSCLLATYKRHRESRDGRSCDLERQLPLREPFFQIKRVPRFKVRNDLHTSLWPAYYPLTRLETASIDDLVYPRPSRSVSILVEGDIGVGKTTICQRLLQLWEVKVACQQTQCMKATSSSTVKDVHLPNLKTPLYLDCSNVTEGSFSSVMDSKSHIRFIVKTVKAMLGDQGCDFQTNDMSDWLTSCSGDVEIYFDNVTVCSGLIKVIEATLDSHKTAFARVMVFTGPSVIHKHRFDNLFYCYGINPDYGSRILTRRLQKMCDFPEHKVSSVDQIKMVDLQGEFFRNPLISSLLADFCKTGYDVIPNNKTDLIQCLLHHSFRSLDGVLQEKGTGGDLERIIVCLRQQAYEGLYRGTHYFNKSVLAESVQPLHLCDLRIIRDIHETGDQNESASASDMFAYSSRGFRDFLASAHVCHLLVNPTISESLLPNLLQDRVFESLCGYCCRQLSVSGHIAVLKTLVETMMERSKQQYVTMLGHDQLVTRGTLCDVSRVLVCLRQTDFQEDVCKLAAQNFPTILEFSLEDSVCSVLQDMIHMMARYELSTHGIVIHMDKMFTQSSLGISLARALNCMTSLTTLMLRATFVADTTFLVHFLCETFQGNTHVKNFTLGGPFNSAENLSHALHRRVASTFTSAIALKTLTIENCSHMHRIAYVIGCWPNIFHRLEVRRCNLEAAGSEVIIKLKGQGDFYHLRLENCYIPSAKLHDVLKCAQMCNKLQVVSLNLLSAKKSFSVMDTHRGTFLPAIDARACSLLHELIVSSPLLEEVTVCHAGLDDVKAGVIIGAVLQSACLKVVDLSGNLITDDVTKDVIDVIKTVKSLRGLMLNNNSFSPEGRKSVVRATSDVTELKLSM
ncbi:uncharacterized protein [Haliotis cracherodii]|uniref:uncharacterized protein n=1 Tax=Haliotis cracherodii TaxID=6455 RepID=UPI0039ED005D